MLHQWRKEGRSGRDGAADRAAPRQHERPTWSHDSPIQVHCLFLLHFFRKREELKNSSTERPSASLLWSCHTSRTFLNLGNETSNSRRAETKHERWERRTRGHRRRVKRAPSSHSISVHFFPSASRHFSLEPEDKSLSKQMALCENAALICNLRPRHQARHAGALSPITHTLWWSLLFPTLHLIRKLRQKSPYVPEMDKLLMSSRKAA